jgi:DNA repair exonuclease SbcCD ATPase subunit
MIMSKMVNLRQKLGEAQDETRKVAGKVITMARTPKYDEHFSAAKLDNWQKDLEKLQSHEEEVEAEIETLKVDPEYLKAQEAQIQVLVTQRDKLDKQLVKVKNELDNKRYNEAELVLAGADPLKLAVEIHNLKESVSRLEEAIGLINAAIQVIER